jgi:uncharacterized protein with FMN-binding domain
MKTHLQNRHSISKLLAGFCLVLAAPLGLTAQTTSVAVKPPTVDQFVGKYRGTAKSAGGKVDLRIEIKANGSELFGSFFEPRGGEQVFSPTRLADGKLRLRLGAAGAPEMLLLQIHDGKLVGEWQVGKETRAVEFERLPAVVEPAVVRVAKAAEPSEAELLTGEWEAAADAQGQTFPFTLVLKVDGEKVTGTSSSQLGESTISSGTWKDGKLAVILEGGSGQIALVGALVDGKLAGDYDYAGQLQGKWVAAKKKP